jgi:putative transposase
MLARIVVSGIAHHVTQRGNRRQPVFFSEEDCAAYVDLVATAARDRGGAVSHGA